ncbi:MAG: hypothetical protein K6G33_01055 [Ruminococcus sp.]|uniref:DUF4153 domain-containing protein n=1 Tax=Ruminococcus sp. TaxID=41978 RepID=UPI0025E8EF46|nr:DUF4153 domain-containing protein [Ruminococcus sp.]MCR5599322.1 hypothetical protein [Ruminococcus sp.]
MDAVRKLKSRIGRRFEKHPIIGYIVYGIFIGFVGTVCLSLLFLGIAAISGLYSRLDINYKTWWTFIAVAAVSAVLVFIYGAMAYFPYRRKGNNLFRKEYVNGTSYSALHDILSQNGEDKE